MAHGLVGVVGIVITHGVRHMWSKHWAALLWLQSCAKFPPVGYPYQNNIYLKYANYVLGVYCTKYI